MPSLRRAVASLVVPGIVLLNCACLCSLSAAIAPHVERASAHTHCHGGDESGAPTHHGAPARGVPGPHCPHCDHVQVSAAVADSANGLSAAPLLSFGVLPPHIAVPTAAEVAQKRSRAVGHSPPALAVLRQKCVLLI